MKLITVFHTLDFLLLPCNIIIHKHFTIN